MRYGHSLEYSSPNLNTVRDNLFSLILVFRQRVCVCVCVSFFIIHIHRARINLHSYTFLRVHDTDRFTKTILRPLRHYVGILLHRPHQLLTLLLPRIPRLSFPSESLPRPDLHHSRSLARSFSLTQI